MRARERIALAGDETDDRVGDELEVVPEDAVAARNGQRPQVRQPGHASGDPRLRADDDERLARGHGGASVAISLQATITAVGE